MSAVELCGPTVYPRNAKALIFQASSFKLLDILPESLSASKAAYLNKQETINAEVPFHSDSSERLEANQRGVMPCLTRRMLRGPAVKQEMGAFWYTFSLFRLSSSCKHYEIMSASSRLRFLTGLEHHEDHVLFFAQLEA